MLTPANQAKKTVCDLNYGAASALDLRVFSR